MGSSRYDVIVVGAGPAGSIAAFQLALGGVSVALVDKATFPRDKACGDIVGPRALQVLADLGLAQPSGREVGDIVVVGPAGRRVRLPCGEGLTYPGHGTAVTRTVFDAMLHDAAVEAGATPVHGQALEPLGIEGRIDGYRLSTGVELRADFVIGADGATSRVAGDAGLVDARKVLWGFALRTYLSVDVELPSIVFWEPERWRGFPGYGWVFPGPAGGTNVGLGLATAADRKAATKVQQVFPRFIEHLFQEGVLAPASVSTPPRRLGGWLKMGIVGTIPASGRVLLVGDAAGLINPLQGEGIAQAMKSGLSAARVLMSEPGRAAEGYRAALAADHLPYHRITSTAQSWLVGRPRTLAAVTRTLMSAGRTGSAAGGWSVFWNELLIGAPPNRHRAVAAAVTRIGDMATAHSTTSRWFESTFDRSHALKPGPRSDQVLHGNRWMVPR